jgi:hypothetical protein
MQFGRFHAKMFLALGLLLLLCQAWITVRTKIPVERTPEETPQPEPEVPAVTGVFGVASLVAGAVLYAASRRREGREGASESRTARLASGRDR